MLFIVLVTAVYEFVMKWRVYNIMYNVLEYHSVIECHLG